MTHQLSPPKGIIQRLIDSVNPFASSLLSYDLFESVLREGDIVFYNYQASSDTDIQAFKTPIAKRIAIAAQLEQLISYIPCSAFHNDDRDENVTNPNAFSGNEVDCAEMHASQSWIGWQHAAIVLLLPLSTSTSKNSVPHIFTTRPVEKNPTTFCFDIVPLRTFLQRTKTKVFSVRHLLINESETKACVTPTSTSSQANDGVSLSDSQNKLQKGMSLKTLSTNARTVIQTQLLNLFRQIFQIQSACHVEQLRIESQLAAFLLNEPAPITRDKKTKQLRCNSTVISASHEYLHDVVTQSAQEVNGADKKSPRIATIQPDMTQHAALRRSTPIALKTSSAAASSADLRHLLPIFAASPAVLALYALYAAHITHLLPRANHTASHLCDNGIIDTFLLSNYQLSDNVSVQCPL